MPYSFSLVGSSAFIHKMGHLKRMVLRFCIPKVLPRPCRYLLVDGTGVIELAVLKCL